MMIRKIICALFLIALPALTLADTTIPIQITVKNNTNHNFNLGDGIYGYDITLPKSTPKTIKPKSITVFNIGLIIPTGQQKWGGDFYLDYDYQPVVLGLFTLTFVGEDTSNDIATLTQEYIPDDITATFLHGQNIKKDNAKNYEVILNYKK